MSDTTLPFTWIVPTDSVVGLRLAKFTPLGLQQLCAGFELCTSVEFQIKSFNEGPGASGQLWVDFPHYELTFQVQRHTLLRLFEQFMFETGTPEPEN